MATKKKTSAALTRSTTPAAEAPPSGRWTPERGRRYLQLMDALHDCPDHARVRRLLEDAGQLADALSEVGDWLRSPALRRSQSTLARFATEFGNPQLVDEFVTIRVAIEHFADTLKAILPIAEPPRRRPAA